MARVVRNWQFFYLAYLQSDGQGDTAQGIVVRHDESRIAGLGNGDDLTVELDLLIGAVGTVFFVAFLVRAALDKSAFKGCAPVESANFDGALLFQFV